MLFPYINEQRFWETFSTLQKHGIQSVQKSWLGLLNMIMAMATSVQASKDFDMIQRFSQSEVYFNRAKALCLDHMNPEASVEAGERLKASNGLMRKRLNSSSTSYDTHHTVSSRNTAFHKDMDNSRSSSEGSFRTWPSFCTSTREV